MKIQKDSPIVQQNDPKVTRKRRTFWDDPVIGEKLDELPEKERSVNIRMALRRYFGIPNTKPIGGEEHGYNQNPKANSQGH